MFSGVTKHGTSVRGLFSGPLNNANRPQSRGDAVTGATSEAGLMALSRREFIADLMR